MKISIEVELEADEIPLAQEMLVLLRQISDVVKPRNTYKTFKQLINKLGEDATGSGGDVDSIVSDVTKIIQESVAGGRNVEDLSREILEAFNEVVFNPELVQAQKSVMSYFGLLPRYGNNCIIFFLIIIVNALRLPEPYKTKMREELIQKVFKFLTLKRPLDANRMEFFAYAEAFASLVKLEFVNITGM